MGGGTEAELHNLRSSKERTTKTTFKLRVRKHSGTFVPGTGELSSALEVYDNARNISLTAEVKSALVLVKLFSLERTSSPHSRAPGAFDGCERQHRKRWSENLEREVQLYDVPQQSFRGPVFFKFSVFSIVPVCNPFFRFPAFPVLPPVDMISKGRREPLALPLDRLGTKEAALQHLDRTRVVRGGHPDVDDRGDRELESFDAPQIAPAEK